MSMEWSIFLRCLWIWAKAVHFKFQDAIKDGEALWNGPLPLLAVEKSSYHLKKSLSQSLWSQRWTTPWLALVELILKSIEPLFKFERRWELLTHIAFSVSKSLNFIGNTKANHFEIIVVIRYVRINQNTSMITYIHNLKKIGLKIKTRLVLLSK